MGNAYKGITRRDFLKGAGCVAAGVAIGLPVLADEVAEEVQKSRVILIRRQGVVSGDGEIDGTMLAQMLDDAMVALCGERDPVTCWKTIVEPDDIVGVKSNHWAPIRTPKALEQAIRMRVIEAGVAADNVDVDDRSVLDLPVFQQATALINTRPMRTHAWAGVGTLLKNYIMFDPHPPDYHPNACADLGSLWNLPIVRGKTRLNILVMLTPQFYTAGPHHFDRTFVWPYSGLIASKDPVAADTIGLSIIQAKRREYFGEDRPMRPVAHHIMYADKKYGLGNSDPAKIDVVRLGWQEGALI